MKRLRVADIIPLAAVFIGGLLLYGTTQAPSIVFGDPSEYALVPHVWGIVHPPGYAFLTLLIRLWQAVVPLGSIAYRTNLLSAVAGAGTATAVYATIGTLSSGLRPRLAATLGALFGAAALLVAPDAWQHAIHTNAHIVTAALASLALFLLTRWRAAGQDRWLYGFGLVAGLGVTQHPLTVFGFPAFALFVLSVRPRILTDRRARLGLALSGLLGLAPWLYFPIRAGIGPPPAFGPDDMNTFQGFLNLVLARGLRVNLFAFGLADQWHRLIVFWSLLRLQYALPVIALALLGLAWLWRHFGVSPANARASDWRGALLLSLHLVVNLAFTLNTVQDVMAYLIIPFATIAVCAGVGATVLIAWLSRWAVGEATPRPTWRGRMLAAALAMGLFAWPAASLVRNYPLISLRQLRTADAYVDAVFAHFAGRGRGAVLLSDWEHMTPLWYRQYVDGETLDPIDVRPVFVVGSSPTLWLDRVWENVEEGPIYLVEYRRDVVDAGFRLRAEGPFYRVVSPPATAAPELTHRLRERAGPLEWLGYEIQATHPLTAGDRVSLLLAFRAPAGVTDVVQPYATLGPYTFHWTTDSHWLTPWWEPGEIIVERWPVIVPLDAEPGAYPLAVGLTNLTSGADLAWSDGDLLQPIATLRVEPAPATLPHGLAANFGQRVGLRAAQAWSEGWSATAPWPTPQRVRPGDAIEIRLDWLGLAPPEDSLTVFVHLLDLGNALWASQDDPPLGGAYPTLLWFPKWLPGQRVTDPYRIVVPPHAPPGDYYLEVGLYGLRSIVRVPNFDADGNLAGDRFVLGGITVLPATD